MRWLVSWNYQVYPGSQLTAACIVEEFCKSFGLLHGSAKCFAFATLACGVLGAYVEAYVGVRYLRFICGVALQCQQYPSEFFLG